MGRVGPLDYPELREVEKLLDTRDIAEAQKRLAKLGDRPAYADGIAYLSARLLHARGRLDLAALAERLKELLARSPDFKEARELMELSTGVRRSVKPEPALDKTALAEKPASSPPRPPSVRPTGPPTDVAPPQHRSGAPLEPPQGEAQIDFEDPSFIDTSAARGASWPPQPKAAPTPAPPQRSDPATVRASPHAPAPSSPGSQPTQEMPQASPSVGRDAFHTAVDEVSGAPSTKGRRYTPISGFDAFGGRRPDANEKPPPPRADVRDIPRAPPLPQFRDNLSAPSYAPGRPDEHDVLKSKSLLPRNAGRYSEAPKAAEVVDRRPGRASRAPRVVRETVPHTPARIRSGAPPQENSALPTLFEIASWIDEGRHRDAIAAVNRAGDGAGPEYAVLRARALAGAGYVDQAFDALQKLEIDRTLDPELRAACARLFVELGAPDRALTLAKQAVSADPDRPLIRLTYALAVVRAARRHPDPALLEQAERALDKLQGREGPLPALYQALKACVQAGAGDAERAISIAQRALGLDPKSEDALAAIAEASARLGRAHDARQAWARLADLSVAESDALAAVLAGHGVPVGGRASPPAPQPEAKAWTPVEVELVSGDRGSAIRSVERAAADAVRRMTKSASQSGFTAVATVAATFLTTTDVTSSFAPFDVSIFSLRRLEAALDVLYGSEKRPRAMADESAFVLLLGAYVGEALRMAYAGHWEGNPIDQDASCIVVGERQVYPFRIVAGRLRQGRRAKISDAIAAALPRPDRDALAKRIVNPVPTPAPWAPRAWPKPSEIGALGRTIARSPIGKFCEDFAEGPLDRTTSSLISLDSYLSLIAPSGAKTDPDSAWMRRVAVFAGGYVGETLRELIGGEWTYGADIADDALAFHLRLKGTVDATPVAHVLERVSGDRSSSLVDYAKTLMRRAERS